MSAKRVLLWRHAKASAGDPRQEDAERVLAPRGERNAATVAGRLLTEPPGLVLCSPAVRARQTLAAAEAGWAKRPELRVEPGLYLADPLALLERLARIEEDTDDVLMVGHNPGLELLVRLLVSNGEPAALAGFAEGFKTGALADLRLEVALWREVGAGCGYLRAFDRPRDLEAAEAP